MLNTYADPRAMTTTTKNLLAAADLHAALLALEPFKTQRAAYERAQRLLAHPRIVRFPMAAARHRAVPPAPVPDMRLIQQSLACSDLEISNGPSFTWTTDEITLEGIELGAFEVTYHIASGTASAEAKTPNPAAGSDGSVTHPHVQDEDICLGGSAQIKRLHELAIAGNFIAVKDMIDSILETYNDESPFAFMENWNSVECDCGATEVSPADISSCCSCNNSVCSDCSRWSDQDGETYCEECANYCDGCGDYYGEGASCNCPNCEESHCPNCLGG